MYISGRLVTTFVLSRMQELKGKCGIVTGGTFGIGLQCAKVLLARGMEKLAILDICVNHDSCRRLIAEYGKTKVLFIKCDVSNAEEMENAFKNIFDLFGRLDLVVNNAGIMDDKNWEKELQVNLNGSIKGTLLGLKYMSKAEGGSGGTIINVSAMSALSPSPGCPIYSTASLAIVGLTKAFALPFHYKKNDVRMITVCPGITYTKIISGACSKMLDEDLGKEWLAQLSVVPTQKPENVANAVVHAFSKGENGSVWVSDGGYPAYRIEFPQISEMRKL